MTCSIPNCDGERYRRGLCCLHYSQARRRGTLNQYSSAPAVPDLPGEEWRSVDGADRLMVSNMGRLLSVRLRPTILKLRVLPSSYGSHLGVIDRKRVVLAKAVLTAFHGPATGAYTRVHYIDGDYRNCRLDNLRWVDDAEYFLPQAITSALLSDHPDSGPLMAFMAGDNSALDHVLREMIDGLPPFVERLARERGIPFDVDADSCVQDALVDGIIKIRQGRGPQAEKLKSWFVGAAKMKFLQSTRERRETLMNDDWLVSDASHKFWREEAV